MTRTACGCLVSVLLSVMLAARVAAQGTPEQGKDAPAATASQAGTPTAARPVSKVTTSLWNYPQGTVAYWAAGASLPASSELNPTRLLVERGASALLAGALRVEGGGTSVPGMLLDSGLLKARGYRLCLMEIESSPQPARANAETGVSIRKLSGVFEIRGGAGHAEFISAIQHGLDEDERARKVQGGIARPLTLPGGVRGMAYARSGEDDWREVSWCSTDSAFLVGFGAGALERWLTAESGRDPAACEWVLHRASATSKHLEGTETAFEAFVDLNALRRVFPEQFAYGPLGAIARAWHLPNARTAMLLAKSTGDNTGRTLQIAAAWSSRSERPGLGRAMLLSAALPANWKHGTTDSVTTVLKADWSGVISLLAETYPALSTTRAASEFNGARTRYLARRGTAMRRVLERLGDATILSPAGPDGVVVRIAIREAKPELDAGKHATIENDLREVLSVPEVSYDGATKSWSLRLSQGDASGGRAIFPQDFAWRVSKDGTALEGRWGAWARENARDQNAK
jgi:hypothetical protein